MTNALLIGLVAGLGAALLFAAAATGVAPVRAALAFVTSLPLAIAGLGWGFGAVAAGAAAGFAVLGLGVSTGFATAFVATQALPMVLVSYLAGLNRATAGGGVEWYPPGRIVIWTALVSATLTLGVLLFIGPDMASIQSAIRGFVETFAQKQFPEISGGKTLSTQEIDDLAEIALVLLPAVMAISVMGTILLNAWLGGRITKASGVLMRPWPDLAALEFPRGVPMLFAAATAGTFLSDVPGLAASALFGALFLGYVLLGLAIIHYVTRGHPWRSFALWGIYGGLVVFNTVASLLIAILGLADAIRPLRQPPPPGRADDDRPPPDQS